MQEARRVKLKTDIQQHRINEALKRRVNTKLAVTWTVRETWKGVDRKGKSAHGFILASLELRENGNRRDFTLARINEIEDGKITNLVDPKKYPSCHSDMLGRFQGKPEWTKYVESWLDGSMSTTRLRGEARYMGGWVIPLRTR